MKPDKDITDLRLVKALAHPLRVRILAVLDEREASPSELAEELEAPLGNVSYHVRILASLDLIRLVKTTPRRGSVEHHYAAIARPVISDQAWAEVPDIVKNAMVGAALEQAGFEVTAAAREGGFNRTEAHLSRTPIELDSEGWQELADELRSFLGRVEEIGLAVVERVAKNKTETALATLVMLLFDSPAEGDLAGGNGQKRGRTGQIKGRRARKA